MSDATSGVPAGSQTVGPYFSIGLEYLLDRTPSITLDTPGTIQMCGRVLDGDGAPVPDAMLEFWNPTAASHGSFPMGFRRAVTNADGAYSVVMERPSQASHMLVLVFARGLLRHLISRVYLPDEAGNQNDSVLTMVSDERRPTLIASADGSRPNTYRWEVILQGTGETVFFAW